MVLTVKDVMDIMEQLCKYKHEIEELRTTNKELVVKISKLHTENMELRGARDELGRSSLRV